MPYVIDSDVLIAISRAAKRLHANMLMQPEGWPISQISAVELIVGARKP
jgi:predicted nucleic acid-binding protein